MANEVFKSKAPGVMRRLMREFPSLSVLDAAAIMGNAGHESGGLATLQETKPTVKGSRGGYGWFQWTGPRRRSFESFCKKRNMAPSSDEANTEYLIYELKGAEKSAIAAVRSVDTLEEKVKAFEMAYERAGVKHYPSRIQYAKLALQAYGPTLPLQPGEVMPEPPAPRVPLPKAKPAAGALPVDMMSVERQLKALGYDVVVDGVVDSGTISSIIQFKAVWNEYNPDKPLTVDASITPEVAAALLSAPLPRRRVNATAKDLKSQSFIVRMASRIKMMAGAAFGGTASVGLLDQVSGQITSVRTFTSTVNDFLSVVPAWFWWGAGLGFLGVVFYGAHLIIQYRVDMHRKAEVA